MGRNRHPATGEGALNPRDSDVAPLVARVWSSRKYRAVVPELVERLLLSSLSRGVGEEGAVKEAKRTLHQIAGSYFTGIVRTDRWRRMLAGGDVRAACHSIMHEHASTRERLPFLEAFYHTLLGDLGPIRSVLDLGCGLNPLSIPWMRLPAQATYVAYDLYEDVVSFLTTFFEVVRVAGCAHARDIAARPPTEAVDVALLLKLLPCLDRLGQGVTEKVLDAIHARWVIVSFPIQSLGGRRDKGMPQNYEERFLALARARPWQVERFEFPTELVFRVSSRG